VGHLRRRSRGRRDAERNAERGAGGGDRRSDLRARLHRCRRRSPARAPHGNDLVGTRAGRRHTRLQRRDDVLVPIRDADSITSTERAS
jgi:hypothetical protein